MIHITRSIAIETTPVLKKAWMFNDGGRLEAGREGSTGDCATRAIAIATGLPYATVYERLAEGNASQRLSKYDKYLTSQGKKPRITGVKSASKGVYSRRKWFKDYMVELGFTWVPTMEVGSGCKVHLRADELPKGRIICRVSRHIVAVINGVIQDTYDCSRNGTRCVYGYWVLNKGAIHANN